MWEAVLLDILTLAEEKGMKVALVAQMWGSLGRGRDGDICQCSNIKNGNNLFDTVAYYFLTKQAALMNKISKNKRTQK